MRTGWRDWFRSNKHLETYKTFKKESRVSGKFRFNLKFASEVSEVNEQWNLYKKASKADEIITKIEKVRKGGGDAVNIWLLKEKTSGMEFVNPNRQ